MKKLILSGLSLQEVITLQPGLLYGAILRVIQKDLFPKIKKALGPELALGLKTSFQTQNDNFDFEKNQYRNPDCLEEAIVFKLEATGACLRICFFGLDKIDKPMIEFCLDVRQTDDLLISGELTKGALFSPVALRAYVEWLTNKELSDESEDSLIYNGRTAMEWMELATVIVAS